MTKAQERDFYMNHAHPDEREDWLKLQAKLAEEKAAKLRRLQALKMAEPRRVAMSIYMDPTLLDKFCLEDGKARGVMTEEAFRCLAAFRAGELVFKEPQ
jgi:hypothetical protein